MLPNYTTSARDGYRPGENRTPDLGIQSPASLASGDSGAAQCRRYLWLLCARDSAVVGPQRSQVRTAIWCEQSQRAASAPASSPEMDDTGKLEQAAGPCSPAPSG